MKTIFASVLLCCSLAAYAQPDNPDPYIVNEDSDPLDFMLSAGLTFGGDDLAVASNDASVTSGGLIYLAVGGVYHVNPNFDMQASFGYHFDVVSADNGTADFTRTFIEIIPFYVMSNGNRLGMGAVGVMSPKFSGPFGGDLNFDDAVGFLVEYDWQLPSKLYIGARFANLTYKSSDGLILMPNGNITDEIDGSYIGVIVQGIF